jgi:hypothetical protein
MTKKFDEAIKLFESNLLDNNGEQRVLATTFHKKIEEKEKLFEGLEVSFGSNNLKQEIFSKYKSKIIHVEDVKIFPDKPVQPKFGRPSTLTFIFKNDFVPDSEFFKILNRNGYFIVKEEKDYLFEGTESYFCQIEPKFPIEIKIDNLSVRFFHIAKKSSLPKILKIGLAPKESQTTFKHPGNRIYLFATKNPELFVESLKAKLSEDKGIEEDSMVALEIDSEFVRNNYLLLDESFEHKPNCVAVFVLKNIPPSFISIYEQQ